MWVAFGWPRASRLYIFIVEWRIEVVERVAVIFSEKIILLILGQIYRTSLTFIGNILGRIFYFCSLSVGMESGLRHRIDFNGLSISKLCFNRFMVRVEA